jgi:hypothetical protein
LLRVARAARIELTHTPRERFNVRNVELLPPSRRTLSRGCSGVGVWQALGFRLGKGVFLDQHALTFVAFPGATEAHDNGVEGWVPGRAASQGGVAALQKHQVRKISAAEAERAFRLQTQEPAFAKGLSTLSAGRVSDNPEHDDVLWLRGCSAQRSHIHDRGFGTHGWPAV